jgi:hypothetical protein
MLTDGLTPSNLPPPWCDSRYRKDRTRPIGQFWSPSSRWDVSPSTATANR